MSLLSCSCNRDATFGDCPFVVPRDMPILCEFSISGRYVFFSLCLDWAGGRRGGEGRRMLSQMIGPEGKRLVGGIGKNADIESELSGQSELGWGSVEELRGYIGGG